MLSNSKPGDHGFKTDMPSDTLNEMGLNIGSYAEALINGGHVVAAEEDPGTVPLLEGREEEVVEVVQEGGETDTVGSGFELPTQAEDGMLDVNDVDVPDSLMMTILGESYVPTGKPKAVVAPATFKAKDKGPAPRSKEDLVEAFRELMVAGRELLQEMATMTGHIGVNMGPPAEDPQGPCKKKSKTPPQFLSKKKKKTVVKEEDGQFNVNDLLGELDELLNENKRPSGNRFERCVRNSKR